MMSSDYGHWPGSFRQSPGVGPKRYWICSNGWGPIQSQVPRAPFLAISSRLPGVGYATVCELFESHRLVKTSNIRGTVHTSGVEQFGWLDAVARSTRARQLRNVLKLEQISPEQLAAEIETFTSDDWRSRAEIVSHSRAWLAQRDANWTDGGPDVLSDSLIWGHSGLLRRPRDIRWEKRTDIYHRRARSLLPDLPHSDFAEALANLVRVHLGSYGPALRQDLSFFFAVGLSGVDEALRELDHQVIHLRGPNDEDYLDLADAAASGVSDPGLRLLPEFDGLLVGYQGRIARGS
jgi:hypothetical protein